MPMPTQEKEKLPRGYLAPRSLVDEARDLGMRLPVRRQGVQCASCGNLFHCLLEKSLRSPQEKVYFSPSINSQYMNVVFNFLISLLTFQATLQRLEGMLEMPSQQEFMQMTSVRNGGDHVNGHGNVQGW